MYSYKLAPIENNRLIGTRAIYIQDQKMYQKISRAADVII